MDARLLVAQRGADSPMNAWLWNNPLVLGLIAIALGAFEVGGPDRGIVDNRRATA